MNLRKISIFFAVLVSILATLTIPVFFPNWPINCFSPLLVILFYQHSYLSCLCTAFLAGVFHDLLSPHIHFGIDAFSYCVSTFILYPQQRHFFFDRVSTLPVMTFCLSGLIAVFELALALVFDAENVLSWIWVITDMVAMPAMDAVYALLCLTLPYVFFGKQERRVF